MNKRNIMQQKKDKYRKLKDLKKQFRNKAGHGSLEWYKDRMTTISGCEMGYLIKCAPLALLNRKNRRLSKSMRKMRGTHECRVGPRDANHWGGVMEKASIAVLSSKHKTWEIIKPEYFLRADKYPLAFDPDGLIITKTGKIYGLEVKCPFKIPIKSEANHRHIAQISTLVKTVKPISAGLLVRMKWVPKLNHIRSKGKPVCTVWVLGTTVENAFHWDDPYDLFEKYRHFEVELDKKTKPDGTYLSFELEQAYETWIAGDEVVIPTRKIRDYVKELRTIKPMYV